MAASGVRLSLPSLPCHAGPTWIDMHTLVFRQRQSMSRDFLITVRLDGLVDSIETRDHYSAGAASLVSCWSAQAEGSGCTPATVAGVLAVVLVCEIESTD
ncbi:hypothetical protein BT67DRAFT_201970 [Trichocladium antarcticum]|uniref:Uncharacterized protein n=1 Tax=Trichocladium antarcticum TaxID=1450529 RepID=A0AAN6UQ15_9PEZI|nr:hypothetical protein BT67DRAFT_201970 [Trichocladium antarcticum]